MFERCLNDRRYKQAVGIAFETRRIDVLQRAIHESVGNLLHPACSFVGSYSLSLSLSLFPPPLSPSPSSTSLSLSLFHLSLTHQQGDIPGMLSYCLKVSLSLISSPRFRNTVSDVIQMMSDVMQMMNDVIHVHMMSDVIQMMSDVVHMTCTCF